MRAYSLAGTPLEEDGVALALAAFRHEDWNRRYEASNLVTVHAEPARFLGELLRDASIPQERRKGLAADVASILPCAAMRRAFSQACICDSSVDEEIKLTLQLFEARFGDRAAFDGLVDKISQLPIEFTATTIALFGHFPDRTLAERAAILIRNRNLLAEEVVRIANSVATGMLYVFEMNFGFGGTLCAAPPHPGISAWTELLEDWVERDELSPQGRLVVASSAAKLGSEWAREKLEAAVFAIENMDGSEWTEDDPFGHTLSQALYEVRRRKAYLSSALIERIVASKRYNVARIGIDALQARGDIASLRRLMVFHAETSDWLIRDLIANAIELMAARLGVVVQKFDHRYQLASQSEESKPPP